MRTILLRFLIVQIVILLLLSVAACDATKRVGAQQYLLKENKTFVNGVRTDDAKINNFLLQKPNSYILGMPLSLYIWPTRERKRILPIGSKPTLAGIVF